MTELRERIEERVKHLPDHDLHQLWDYLQYLTWRKISPDREDLTTDQSHAQDRLVGLFEGPPDLATRSESIVQETITERSGWTWKENSQ